LDKIAKDNKIGEKTPNIDSTLEQIVDLEHIAKIFGSTQNMVISQIKIVVVEGIPEVHLEENSIVHKNPIIKPLFSMNCDKKPKFKMDKEGLGNHAYKAWHKTFHYIFMHLIILILNNEIL
jgi:hypothetical protein